MELDGHYKQMIVAQEIEQIGIDKTEDEKQGTVN
jgi:hypothetical protein